MNIPLRLTQSLYIMSSKAYTFFENAGFLNYHHNKASREVNITANKGSFVYAKLIPSHLFKFWWTRVNARNGWVYRTNDGQLNTLHQKNILCTYVLNHEHPWRKFTLLSMFYEGEAGSKSLFSCSFYFSSLSSNIYMAF